MEEDYDAILGLIFKRCLVKIILIDHFLLYEHERGEIYNVEKEHIA